MSTSWPAIIPTRRRRRRLVAAAAASLAAAACWLAGPGPADADAAAARGVARTLAAEGLRAGPVRCEGAICRWRARRLSRGWTYRCRGRAERARRGWRLTPCRLRAPRLAPLKRRPSQLRAFGYNDLSIFLERQIEIAPAAGADSMRVILYWNMVEPVPGAYSWQLYDRVYRRMLALGLRPLFIVLGAPCWAAASPGLCQSHFTSMPPADAAFDDYARFTAAAARRYPEAIGFEVWNEPNIEQFWWPGPEPGRYARLLAATEAELAVRAPAVTLVSAGLYPVGEGIAGTQMRDTAFLRRVYEAGAARGADAIGAHPYPGGRRQRHLEDVRRRLARLRTTMARFGDEAKPLWVTEVGLSTTGPEQGRYKERDQATALVDLYRMLRRIPGSPVTYFHTFFDLEGSAADVWTGMGIVRSDRSTRKPAFCALAVERGLSC